MCVFFVWSAGVNGMSFLCQRCSDRQLVSTALFTTANKAVDFNHFYFFLLSGSLVFFGPFSLTPVVILYFYWIICNILWFVVVVVFTWLDYFNVFILIYLTINVVAFGLKNYILKNDPNTWPLTPWPHIESSCQTLIPATTCSCGPLSNYIWVLLVISEYSLLPPLLSKGLRTTDILGLVHYSSRLLDFIIQGTGLQPHPSNHIWIYSLHFSTTFPWWRANLCFCTCTLIIIKIK